MFYVLQDHNYGAPPPPTPPASPPPPPPPEVNGHLEEVCATTAVLSQTSDAVDDSITRCICDYVHDDGYMICCDKCR